MIEVTKNEFRKYTDVQVGGATNMSDINKVMSLSGLTKEKILYIIEHYNELQKKYKIIYFD